MIQVPLRAEADRLFREAIARRLPLVTTDLVLAEVYGLTLGFDDDFVAAGFELWRGG